MPDSVPCTLQKHCCSYQQLSLPAGRSASYSPGKEDKRMEVLPLDEFPKYKEGSLILYPSYVLMYQARNQRGSFKLVWLTLLHKRNHVYIIVTIL